VRAELGPTYLWEVSLLISPTRRFELLAPLDALGRLLEATDEMQRVLELLVPPRGTAVTRAVRVLDSGDVRVVYFAEGGRAEATIPIGTCVKTDFENTNRDGQQRTDNAFTIIAGLPLVTGVVRFLTHHFGFALAPRSSATLGWVWAELVFAVVTVFVHFSKLFARDYNSLAKAALVVVSFLFLVVFNFVGISNEAWSALWRPWKL
jgi:hypothetical protein